MIDIDWPEIRASRSAPQLKHHTLSLFQKPVNMLPATTLKPTFTGPRVPVAQRSRAVVSRASTVRVRAGPYDEELIATAVRGPSVSGPDQGASAGVWGMRSSRWQ